MQLMPLDLPAPVAPAISRCGVVARSRNTALPAMSLPIGDLERTGGGRRLRRRQQVAEGDELAGVVGHLDADRRAAGDRRQDAHVDGRHGVGDVALQAGDAGDLDAGAELELVAGDGRADGHADERRVDAVLGERLLEHPAARLDLGPVDRLGAGAVEERDRRQRPRARAAAPSGGPRSGSPGTSRLGAAAAGAAGRDLGEVVGGVVDRRRRQRRGSPAWRRSRRRRCASASSSSLPSLLSDDRSRSAWRAARHDRAGDGADALPGARRPSCAATSG